MIDCRRASVRNSQSSVTTRRVTVPIIDFIDRPDVILSSPPVVRLKEWLVLSAFTCLHPDGCFSRAPLGGIMFAVTRKAEERNWVKWKYQKLFIESWKQKSSHGRPKGQSFKHSHGKVCFIEKCYERRILQHKIDFIRLKRSLMTHEVGSARFVNIRLGNTESIINESVRESRIYPHWSSRIDSNDAEYRADRYRMSRSTARSIQKGEFEDTKLIELWKENIQLTSVHKKLFPKHKKWKFKEF